MMEAPADCQREDGGWQTFWSEVSSPAYFKVLVLSKAISREEMGAACREALPRSEEWV